MADSPLDASGSLESGIPTDRPTACRLPDRSTGGRTMRYKSGRSEPVPLPPLTSNLIALNLAETRHLMKMTFLARARYLIAITTPPLPRPSYASGVWLAFLATGVVTCCKTPLWRSVRHAVSATPGSRAPLPASGQAASLPS